MKIIKKFLVITSWILLIPTANASKLANSAIVMDINSGRVLYEQNADRKQLIASTTKIMTAILAIEQGNLSEEVTVGEEVLKMYGTNIYIEVGEKITLLDLLYGLILRSGNDAAVAIAVAVSGSEAAFVDEMNKKAQELGMSNSTFSNPHGLDEETKNYSTARDMAVLMKYAYGNELFRTISATKKYETSTENKTYLWYNRNKLLINYKYCTGGKNGYTPSAGKTFVSTATKDSLNLIAVTLNDSDIYSTHENLYNRIFNQYKNYKIIDRDNFKIESTSSNEKIYVKESFYYPLTDSEKSKIKTIVHLNNSSSSKKGDITIYLGNKKIGKVPIYQEITQKKEENFFSKIKSYLLDNLKKLTLGKDKNLMPFPFVPIPLDMNKSLSSSIL